MMTDRRILTIQDISCVGQCSLTAAQPIISACGVEACVLPSAVLSTHTGGFGTPSFRDLTDDMPRVLEHWERAGIFFDAVLCGYLGSGRQVTLVKELMQSRLLPGGRKIVDPAMADRGRLYSGFDDSFVSRMAELCSFADIILPNLTEACFLTGTEYLEGGFSEDYVRGLLKKLAAFCTGIIVLKGITFEEGKIGIAVFDVKNDLIRFSFSDKIGTGSHGTGDCFAAAFTGALMQGLEPYAAAVLAADFVSEALLQTAGDPEHWYGVKFEKALPFLVHRLNRAAPATKKAKAAAGKRPVFTFDGSSFDDLPGFYREMSRLLTDGSPETGDNLDSLNDLLRGGFGKHRYGEPIELRWENFSDSRKALGEGAMLRILSVILNSEDDHDCLLRISE